MTSAAMTEHTALEVALFNALRKLTMMARTSGGIAGPDPMLMDACDEAEALISRFAGGDA